MTLTSGTGPLHPNRAGRFSAPVPEGVVYAEPHRRRVRGIRDGRTVVDTEQAWMVHRAGHAPEWVFPPSAVEGLPSEPSPDVDGFVRVPWAAADHWFEETDEVFWHPRNPYHRVDCMPTARHLRVEVEGTVLVDTDDTVLVHETSLPPRLYVSRAHVRTDLLVPTDTVTYCNYKGRTTYYAAVLDGVRVDDVAWSYEHARDESRRIEGLLSFDESRVAVTADLPG